MFVDRIALCHLVPRAKSAGDSDEKSCGVTVVMDEDENIILIHFQNILDNYVLEQRHNIRKKFKSELREGWCKGCGFSGDINVTELERILEENTDARKGYFGRFQEEYGHEVNVTATYQGTGASAKAIYTNCHGQTKTWQAGNHLNRIVKDTKKDCDVSNGFLEIMLKILKVCGDYVHFPQDRATRKNQKKMSTIQKTPISKTSLAINYNWNGSSTPWAMHRDAHVFVACVVNTENKNNEDPQAGYFLYEVGGLLLQMEKSDLLVFNGYHLHSPLMPTLQDPKKNGKAGCYSYVLFCNIK